MILFVQYPNVESIKMSILRMAPHFIRLTQTIALSYIALSAILKLHYTSFAFFLVVAVNISGNIHDCYRIQDRWKLAMSSLNNCVILYMTRNSTYTLSYLMWIVAFETILNRETTNLIET